MPASDLEPMAFDNRTQWRQWLEEHHATAREAWLVHYKKRSGLTGLSYEEAVEEALCFGWIDGLMHSIDEGRYALRYSPRRKGSLWSESNKRRVERLTQQGRMSEAGLVAVAEAQASGEWEAAAVREDATAIPDDLRRELEARQTLGAFESWPASHRRQYLYWLGSAKRPTTRRRRLAAILEAVAAQEPEGR